MVCGKSYNGSETRIDFNARVDVKRSEQLKPFELTSSVQICWIQNRSGSKRYGLPPVWEIAVHLAVACDVYDGVFLCCLFPTRCLG